jgi:hypothetical protein
MGRTERCAVQQKVPKMRAARSCQSLKGHVHRETETAGNSISAGIWKYSSNTFLH